MTQFGTTMSPVRYDPVTQCFEALVTLHEGNDQVRIPVSLKLPIYTDANTVAPALIRQAKEKRQMRRLPLRSRLHAALDGSAQFDFEPRGFAA